MDLFHKLQAVKPEKSADKPNAEKKQPSDAGRPAENLSRIFLFDELKYVLKACSLVRDIFSGTSSLYKDNRSLQYLLVLSAEGDEADSFQRSCNILSEYSTVLRRLPAGNSFLEEHCETLVRDHAIASLGTI